MTSLVKSTDEPIFFDMIRSPVMRDYALQLAEKNPKLLRMINLNGYDIIIDLLIDGFET